ncbi:MAG: peroxiredoxin [Pseudomonadota bacterium]
MTTDVSEGDKVPEFDLATDGEASASSASLAGKPYVIYFYPKDDTSGCTKEAIGFSEMIADFEAAGVAVIGVSPDTVEKHAKFRAKHNLTVTLAADPDKTTLEAFGVWKEKSMYGKKYMGVERSTFLVGSDGTVQKAWRKVKVPGHVEDVLAAAKALD